MLISSPYTNTRYKCSENNQTTVICCRKPSKLRRLY